MSLKRYALGLAAVGLSSVAIAQPPIALAVPGGPGAFPPMAGPLPGPGPVGIAPRPAMPTQNTLWSYLGISADQREYRQRANADTRLGELRQRILPNPRLKSPSLAELQAPGAVGAASQVKLDRANAEKRMEAVQYLGTVDCHYWPEAEDALIGALRGDRNECVRLAAAQVLLNCCCCTKKVIKALTEAANGTDCDGFPSEKSSRVRAAAQTALEKCLTCFCDQESKCPDKNCDKTPPALPELAPLPKPGGEKTDDPKKSGEKTSINSYYDRVARTPSAVIIADARKALSLSIPMDVTGATINQADLIAAGEPGPFDAGMRSPKPTSLIGFFTSKPAPESAPMIVERPMVAVKPTPMSGQVANSRWSPSPAPAMANNVPPAPKPLAVNTVPPPMKPVPVASTALPPLPTPVKPAPAASATLTPLPPPVKSAPVASATLMPLPPPVKSAPVASATLTPLPPPVKPALLPPVKPVSVATTTVNSNPVTTKVPAAAPAMSKSAPTVAGPVSLPKPLPASVPETPKADRAEKVAKMMRGLVPVSELTAGIDQLTAEDLRTHPALVSELIAAGSRSTSVPVRLSTVQALVRCGVKTQEAMSVLQTAAQTDPESAVRTAATSGLKK